METQNLAKKVKELRALRGMSQEYLAEESHVSLRTIQRIESCESVPTGETIKRIASALDVSMNELIGSNLTSETLDIKASIIFLKKQRSKTNKKSEIKTFEKFIQLLKSLKEKDLSNEQKAAIEGYIQYLELEKIPSFSNDLYKEKLKKFKSFLKKNLGFVPTNFYTVWISSFAIAFASGFSAQSNVELHLKIGVISIGLVCVGIGMILDTRIKKQNRSFDFWGWTTIQKKTISLEKHLSKLTFKKIVFIAVLFLLNSEIYCQNTYEIENFNMIFKSFQALERSSNKSGDIVSFDNDDLSVEIEQVSFDNETSEFLENAEFGANEIARDYELRDITKGGILKNVKRAYYVKGFDLDGEKKYPVYVIVILDDVRKVAFEISIDCYNISISEGEKIVQSFTISS